MNAVARRNRKLRSFSHALRFPSSQIVVVSIRSDVDDGAIGGVERTVAIDQAPEHGIGGFRMGEIDIAVGQDEEFATFGSSTRAIHGSMPLPVTSQSVTRQPFCVVPHVRPSGACRSAGASYVTILRFV